MKSVVVLALLLLAASPARLFLFGSVLVDDGNPAYRKLVEVVGKPTRPGCDQNWDSTDCPKVAVITSACPDSDCGEEEYNTGDEEEAATGPFFVGLGMAPRHVKVHVDNFRTATDPLTYLGERNYQAIGQADIIYFNGGDQSRHARCWFNDDGQPNPIFALLKRRALNNEVVIVGVSAGTAIQTPVIYGGGSSFGILYFSNLVGLAPNSIASGNGLNDVRNGTDCLQYEENGAKLQGFGFIDTLQVDTHFDRRGRLGRLVPALVDLHAAVGVGIDELATLYYDGNTGTVFGKNGVFIVDVGTALKVQSKYFHMKGVKVHYLTEGDSFDFRFRTVKTSKPPIVPRESGFSDSDNILAPYECTRLITRLVDQKGVFNEGRTRVPADEDYPDSAPAFSFSFYKGEETRGYRAGEVITAEGVMLDISAETRQ